MQYENNFYLTHDRSLDIEFLFVDRGGSIGWRAYILSDIDYKGRSTLCGTIHRLTESSGVICQQIRRFLADTREVGNRMAPIYYICWSQSIHSLEDMREVSKTWAEITAYYIKHGGSFQTIQKTLKNRGIITL